MSIWINKKDKDGKSHILAIEVPIMGVIILLGLFTSLFAPRYFLSSEEIVIKTIARDSACLLVTGFLFILISKISLFRKRIWISWGSKLMTKPFRLLYKFGYLLMLGGVLISLVILSN